VTVPAPACSKCGKPTDGKARTLCTPCRDKAKHEYLRAQRTEQLVSVQIGGVAAIMAPPGLPGVATPESMQCQECGEPKLKRLDALCERCMVNLPMSHIEAHQRYRQWLEVTAPHGAACACPECSSKGLGAFAMMAGVEGPPLNWCSACGGGYSGPPTMPPCPQCKAEAAGGLGPSAGQPPACTMCGEVCRGAIVRFRGGPVCEPCQGAFSQVRVATALEGREARGHPVLCTCPGCTAERRAIIEARSGSPHFAAGGVIPQPPGMSSHHAVATGMYPLFGGASMGVGGVSTRGHGSSMPPPGGPRQPPERVNLEEPDPDRAPDLIEPVLAWRGWNVTADGHLVAAAQDGIWDPGPNRAACNRGNHVDIPAVGCGCGFYGWHKPEQIAHGSIWGALKCWGEIIVHDVGIRAEYAEIICIVERPGGEMDPHQLARVVDRYKVPIARSLEEAEVIATKEGILVPDSMKPQRDGPDENETIARKIAQGVQSGRVSLPEARRLLEAAGATNLIVGPHSIVLPAVGPQPPMTITKAGIAAMQSMAQVGASVGSALSGMGQAAGAMAQGFSAISKVLIFEKPKPTSSQRFRLNFCLEALVLAAWIAFAVTYAHPHHWPAWCGAVFGGMSAATVWFTPFPDAVFRLWRAWRCLFHASHLGLWCDPPEGVPRSVAPPFSQAEPSRFSAKLKTGERCIYCWRKRHPGPLDPPG
jgi:hypothetical protein